MTRRSALRGGAGVIVLALGGFGGWILCLPAAPAAAGAPPIDSGEANAIVDALKPPKRQRPVVAVVGINDATETTDYLMPTGILRRADVAHVITVATSPGSVVLHPALTVQADVTVAEFDARYPDGADYVIVPAMSRDNDPAARASGRRTAKAGRRAGRRPCSDPGTLRNANGRHRDHAARISTTGCAVITIPRRAASRTHFAHESQGGESMPGPLFAVILSARGLWRLRSRQR